MKLSLNNGSSSGVTIISNIFIDYYMPHANGEFVKIYLYLLRCLKSEDKELDLAQVADIFNCTESDIIRTLRYWESKRIVVLSGGQESTSIDFLEPMMPDGLVSSKIPQTVSHTKKEKKIKKVAPTNTARTETAPALDKNTNNNASEPLPAPPTADRLRELKEMEEVGQMLYIAEQYMGTTLSTTAINELLYIYDTLKFSVDLIDYLIEYSVSKGSKSIHYIKAVALKWHENGIDSVSKAKMETTTFHRNYFTILKALGITNRNPLPSEINIFNQWLNEYGFTLDIITEACSRTVAQTGKANHKYTTKILKEWHSKGVHHLTDIQALDTLHRQSQTDRAEQKSNNKSANNSGTNRNTASNSRNFNNFNQRDYDFAALEEQLLNQ